LSAALFSAEPPPPPPLVGFGVGYSLDAIGPVFVSSVLSLLVFREITDPHQIRLYCAAFLLQLSGAVLITCGSHQ